MTALLDVTTTVDLYVRQRETYAVAFPVLDANNTPVSVDGWTARGQVRHRWDSLAVLHEWSTVHQNITCQGSSVLLQVPDDVSAGWSWLTAVYDLTLTNPAGAVARLAQGRVYVLPAVTR